MTLNKNQSQPDCADAQVGLRNILDWSHCCSYLICVQICNKKNRQMVCRSVEKCLIFFSDTPDFESGKRRSLDKDYKKIIAGFKKEVVAKFHLLFIIQNKIYEYITTKAVLTFWRLACRVKISADYILKYFSYFPQKTGFDISCKLSPKETICMKCQSMFSSRDKKNVIINLSSAESAQLAMLAWDCEPDYMWTKTALM